MKYRTLVFDFDGTIADTLGEARKIFNQLAPDYGIRQVDDHEVFAKRGPLGQQFARGADGQAMAVEHQLIVAADLVAVDDWHAMMSGELPEHVAAGGGFAEMKR
jgi:phosphoglycolate phosphatase-like HAD superfamily hydrolase